MLQSLGERGGKMIPIEAGLSSPDVQLSLALIDSTEEINGNTKLSRRQ